MERNIVRMLIIAAFLFLLAGNFTQIFYSTLNMMGMSMNIQHGKTANGKTGSKGKIDLSDSNDLDVEDEDGETLDLIGASPITKSALMATIRNSCLPKLICELNATPHKDRLTESERSLLSFIRDTSIRTTAEVTSKYHFAAHMGQLIAGIEGTGCHNFYPGCPFPGLQVLQMLKKVKVR